MSSVYSCSGTTNTQDVECNNVSCCGVARPSNFDLDIDEVVGHHVEAQRSVCRCSLWDARIMTGDDRLFFGVVEFEAYDQSPRSNLIAKQLQLIVSHSASHGAVRATSDMNRHANNNHAFPGFLALCATGAHWEHVAGRTSSAHNKEVFAA